MTRFSRRAVLGSMALGLLGCGLGGRGRWGSADVQTQMNNWVSDKPGQPRAIAGVGLLVHQHGHPVARHVAGQAAGLGKIEQATGQPLRPFTTATKMRVASISKTVVGLTTLSLAERGELDLNADVRQWWPGLSNPHFPPRPMTLLQLLSHQSSLIDPPEYWIRSPGRIATLIKPSCFSTAYGPGNGFGYCNLNYAIVATLLERMSGQRFDQLARQQTLMPLQLSAGFNWSGVPSSQRRSGATLYRRVGDDWQIQVDGPRMLADAKPAALVDDDFSLDNYDVGSNGSLFSPQGGLRASLEDLVVIARAMSRSSRMLGSFSVAKGDPAYVYDSDGLFGSAGPGCFAWNRQHSPISGQRMLGHDGEAYGLYAGAWHLPDLDAQVAFAVTGTPEGPQPLGRRVGYNRWSQGLFDGAARISGADG